MEDIKKMIRDVYDFPKKGIIFRGITTAIKDPKTMQKIVDLMAQEYVGEKIDYVAGIESRGFILACLLLTNWAAVLYPSENRANSPLKPFLRNMSLSMERIK